MAMQLIEHLPTTHKALDLIPSISLNREAGEMTHMASAGQSSWLTRPAALALQVWCPLLTPPYTLKLKKGLKKLILQTKMAVVGIDRKLHEHITKLENV